jgi:hypothetical protein
MGPLSFSPLAAATKPAASASSGGFKGATSPVAGPVAASPAATAPTAAAASSTTSPAAADAPSAARATSPPLPPAVVAAGVPSAGPPPGPGPSGKLEITAQNVLAHIPGEASGFYLMAVGAIDKPPVGTLIFIFLLALILLVLIRWAAKATKGVMLTSVLAFGIWMLILDKGVLHVLMPTLLPGALGLVVAVFYSIVVTTLANTGKLT